jgi:predicted MFS family arabinose efflux permease
VLLVAQLFSEIGDWAARVALAVLVLDRTDSAAMTGLVVTVSVLPWVGLGQWLATLGDRLPRRQVMIICDVIRAAAFLALLIPMPIGVLLLLTFIAGLPSPPFAAARAALLPDSVPGNQYPDALAVAHITSQTTLVLGYLTGGILVAVITAQGALVANSLSFIASAVVLTRLRIGRTAVAADNRMALRAGARGIWSDVMIRRAVILYALVCGGAIIPESLVAVYALRHLGTGDAGPGLLAAAVPIGTIAISSAVPFHGTARSLLKVAALIAICGAAVALVFFVGDASMPTILIGFLAVGVVFGTLIPTNTVFGTRIPNETRASAFGLAQGALLFAEGSGAAVGGAIASAWGVRTSCVAAMTAVLVGSVVYLATIPADPLATSAARTRKPPAPPPSPRAADDEESRTPPAPPPRPRQTA